MAQRGHAPPVDQSQPASQGTPRPLSHPTRRDSFDDGVRYCCVLIEFSLWAKSSSKRGSNSSSGSTTNTIKDKQQESQAGSRTSGADHPPPPFQESGNEGNNEMKFTNKRQPTIVFIAFCRCGCCECAAIVSFGFLAAVVSFCPAFCGSCCQTTPNNIIPAYCRRWLLIKTPSTCCSSSCSSRCSR